MSDDRRRAAPRTRRRACAPTPATRAAHCRDTWVMAELRRSARGRAARRRRWPCVEPASTEEVSRALRALPRGARRRGPVRRRLRRLRRDRGPRPDAVVLSTRRARRPGRARRARSDSRASAPARMGIDAERARPEGRVSRIGHWPQSIEISTVGGWVATRAAGQFSTALRQHRGSRARARGRAPRRHACCARARRRAPRPVPTCASSSWAAKARSAS